MKKILILCILIILTWCTQNYDGWDWYKWDVDINWARNWYWVYYYSNWDHYEGNWVNNNSEWYWKMFWSDGTRYEWNWENDKMQWQWKMFWVDWSRYEWNWVNNNREWYWKMFWSDGTRYEWNWENDKMQWQWTKYFANWFRVIWTYVNWYLHDWIEYDSNWGIAAIIKDCLAYTTYNWKLQPIIINGTQDNRCKWELSNDLNNSNVQGNNLDDFLDIVLWQWVRWWMTEDDILKKYWLNNKNAEIWFPNDMNYLDTKKYDRVRFIKWNVMVELWFFYFDNNYRLYSYELKYPYNENSYENAKNFLIENFWGSTRMTVHNCLTCKEWYEYKKLWTSAYLKKDLGNNFLDWKDNIENYIIEYVSDEIASKIK